MLMKNLKVLVLSLIVLGFYTGVAHIVPQFASEVPEALDASAMSPDQLASAGEKVYNGAGGCGACHGLGTRAPNLLTDEKGEGQIGARCGKREPNKDCKHYLWEAMTEPGEFVVKGYEPIMPDMRRSLDGAQIWAVIAYLESQGGEITVTSDDVKSASGDTDDPAPSGGGAATASSDPKEILNANGCLGCHKLGDEGNQIGPPLTGIGGRVSKDYIRESILDPNAKVPAGFEAMKGMMPPTFGEQLTAKQLEILVNFLASQK